ncbi:fused PTS fructose transporter subunit IIA/HPr protein [Utexia brackfieldae]|uniref:fused PTS fructose transporter subunit IIA/HPr protein n=1 Tax=Utexia brackfieldae TaxID=3074108 RepID=UPI00370D470B
MFELVAKDVHMNQSAQDKTQAIKSIAQALVEAGFVEEGYGEGMLQREQQAATYLDNGIAIPHGTTTTRYLVKKTGVQVFHFPQGVKWGDEDQLAYVAIGIAASSDEHLELLRQLTRVLGDDDVEDRLKQVKSADDIVAILTGKSEAASDEIIVDTSLMMLDIPADSLQTLQALNASRLQKIAAVNTAFLTSVIEHQPSYLGEGIWLSDSAQGNLKNAVAISRPTNALTEQDKPVNLLMTISSVNDAFSPIIDKLAQLLFNRQAKTLLNAGAQTLAQFFDVNVSLPPSTLESAPSSTPVEADVASVEDTQEGFSRELTVLNPHGLHTRPSSVLIKVIKAFKSTVKVTNLSGSNKPVNAASLIKVVALGAKKGDRLLFTAEGPDAQQVLDAIEKAMAEGLGEGVE